MDSGMDQKIEKFDGKNSFSLWQIKMRAILRRQSLWAPVATAIKGKKDPKGKAEAVSTDEDSKKAEKMIELDEKAHSQIIMCLDDEILADVSGEETAGGLWLKLEELFLTKSLTNKLYMKKKLFTFQMVEGTPIKDHLDQYSALLLELRNLEIKIDDEDAALILLVSLPLSFESYVDSCINKETITLESVKSGLKTRELRRKASGTSTESSGLAAEDSKWRGKRNGGSRRGPRPGDICSYCKEKGHWRTGCPKKKSDEKKRSESTAALADCARDDDDLALLTEEGTCKEGAWVLDSGASYHICSRKEQFATYEQKDGGRVYMANGSTCEVVGIGSVRVRTYGDESITLNKVRHVPTVAKNLVSLSRLDKKGYKFKGEGGALDVYKGSDVVMRGKKEGGLYVLKGSEKGEGVDKKVERHVTLDGSERGKP